MLVVVLRAECAALQVGAFRKRLEKVVGDKHEEVMGRMGAIMATGAPARPPPPRSCTMQAGVVQQESWLGSMCGPPRQACCQQSCRQ